jgi:ABC-type branched-subunit amino acid transport system ATPase component
MLEIARVLAMDPTVMLLDEPTSGLTLEARGRVAEILKRVRAEVGATQIVIEHDVTFMRNICDRLVVLNFGEILATGDPEDVLNDDRVRVGYLGVRRQSKILSERILSSSPDVPGEVS